MSWSVSVEKNTRKHQFIFFSHTRPKNRYFKKYCEIFLGSPRLVIYLSAREVPLQIEISGSWACLGSNLLRESNGNVRYLDLERYLARAEINDKPRTSEKNFAIFLNIYIFRSIDSHRVPGTQVPRSNPREPKFLTPPPHPPGGVKAHQYRSGLQIISKNHSFWWFSDSNPIFFSAPSARTTFLILQAV